MYESHHSRFILGWWRFIDDIFVIWTGNTSQLNTFHAFLNQIDQSIQFTLTYSHEKIQFLDTEISLRDGTLHSDLYFKKTDRNTLLKYNSCHPRKMVKSLPLSQMLRVRRIVDTEDRVDKALAEMVTKFKERGYPHTLIELHKKTVRGLKREEALRSKTKKGQSRIPFISTYCDWSERIGRVINKHWYIVQNCHSNIKEFMDRPLLSYRRPTNLHDRLVNSDVGPLSTKKQTFLTVSKKGSFPCLSCISCNYMAKGDSFVHPKTNKRYKIKFYLTCNSNYVIYVLWCPCDLLYVGETRNDMKTRLNQHRYSIRKKRLDLPVSKHFLDANHSERDLKFMILDHIPVQRTGGDRILRLKKKELMWIHTLNTLNPNGLNVDFKVLPGM